MKCASLAKEHCDHVVLPRRRISAFSLSECILVLVLISILSVTAVPVISGLLATNASDRAINRLARFVRAARALAIADNVTTRLCPSADGVHCGMDWSAGWLIRQVGHQPVLRVAGAIPQGLILRWRASFGRNADLKFAPTGYTLGQQGSFELCATDKSTGISANRRLVLSASGRVRVDASSLVLKRRCNEAS